MSAKTEPSVSASGTRTKDPNDPDTDPAFATALVDISQRLGNIERAVFEVVRHLTIRGTAAEEELRDWREAWRETMREWGNTPLPNLTRTLGTAPATAMTLNEYNVVTTDTGNIKISPAAWDEMQRRIADLDHERALKAAEERGASKVLEDFKRQASEREARAERVRRNITVAVPLAGLVGAGLAWLFAHWH